jgi:thiamine kinase-like enzyme
MKLVYDNYNKLYLHKSNDEEVYIKKFKNQWSWNNEILANALLAKNGFYVPKILEIKLNKITYESIKYPQLDTLLSVDKFPLTNILDYHQSFINQASNGFKMFSEKDIKNQLHNVSFNLKTNNILSDSDFCNVLLKIDKFKMNEPFVIHGDFRTENIFISDNIVLIDFEYTGIGDPNKDLAYFWIDCTRLNKDLNSTIRNAYKELSYYKPNQFDFWVVYFHIMVLYNPKVTDKLSWLTNLRHILENKNGSP